MAKKMKVTNSELSYLEEESKEIQQDFDPVLEELIEESDESLENNDNNSEEVVSIEYYVSGTQPLIIAGERYLPNSRVPNSVVEKSPQATFFLNNGHLSVRNKS